MISLNWSLLTKLDFITSIYMFPTNQGKWNIVHQLYPWSIMHPNMFEILKWTWQGAKHRTILIGAGKIIIIIIIGVRRYIIGNIVG